ncbi:hypothetical protein BKD09_27200 [Bradyrhizobium japonicum]|uniref:Uncharacterized protein n=1 Tax=Bradyrhizobium japonicum TaxID=375 RepID=A0A1L3FFF2_BRAJP|nr:hypothetical protein BKD09_27200 [Bradyrhizobium japonicum]
MTLDPAVRSLSFVASLALAGEDIDIHMLVAEHDDGLVAYDIVDERDDRDIDTEGLLLIALDQHHITLRAMDAVSICAQPFARHCERVWEYRSFDVDHSLRARIQRALKRERLSLRELGRTVGEPNIMPIVCKLICERILCCDLSASLDLDAWVACRPHRAIESSLIDRKTPEPMKPKPGGAT